MRKFLLAVTVVLVVFVTGIGWLLSDANRFKPQLVELIQINTGLAVAIRCDLAWRLWPPVQLVAQDVSADWAAEAAEPMLAARTLRLDADLWPLLAKNSKLVINGVSVDGLRAQLKRRGEHANWMPPEHAGVVAPPIPIPPPTGAASAPWEVADIALSDAVIDYVVDDQATQITIDALHISDIAPTRRFPFHAKLTIKQVDREIPLTVAAELTFDELVTQWQIDTLDIRGVFGNPGVPFALKANARLDTAAGTLDLTDAELELAKATTRFDVAATDLLKSARYSGHLDLPQQNLTGVASLFGAQLYEPVGVKTAFTATEQRLDLTDMTLHYGPSVITGKLGTPLATKLNVDFDLATERFEVPSKQTTVATLGGGSFAALAFAAPAVALDPTVAETLLPLELLRATDWSGTLAIGQLLYAGATFANATIVSNNDGGNVDALIDLPAFFGGSATTSVKIDANADAPQWNVTPKLTQVDSQALLKWLDKKYDWVALFAAGGQLGMRGNTTGELIASMNGRTTFDGGEGVLNIEEIKHAALRIAEVAGGADKVSAWPDRLKYQRFTGTWDVNGTDLLVDVALDNLTLHARGKLDALADDMDMRVAVTVTDDPQYQSFKIGSALMGLPLPMRCKGSIAAPKCGADEDGTRKLIAQALSGSNPEMTERLNKTIDEKVPEQYRDAARSLLDLLKKGNQQPPKSP